MDRVESGGWWRRVGTLAGSRLTGRAADRGAGAVAVRLGLVLIAFVGATVGIALVEAPPLAMPDASSLYLVAVVVAAAFGARAAVAAALAAFLLYDLLFIEPRLTLTVDDPREWLALGLFLFVGVTIGRLAGRHSDRASGSERRLHETRSLFRISRTLATAGSTAESLPAVLGLLLEGSRMERIRFARAAGGREIVESEAGEGPAPDPARIATVLVRMPGNQPARWVRSHQAGAGRAPSPLGPGENAVDLYRVRVEADGETLGSLWATRGRSVGPPGIDETRLLSLAADQIGLALLRERLAAEAKDADEARRREAVERTLLESVSHDLRTPLASIRATAGSLADPSVDWPDEDRRAAALRIDAEADRLDRLVDNLLDLSRIEGGTVVPQREAWDVAALVESAVARLDASTRRLVRIELPADLPPVLVDPVLLDQSLSNVLENARLHAPGATITIEAAVVGGADEPDSDGRGSDSRGSDGPPAVRLRIVDDGPGVPPASLGRLFTRFYRVPQPRPSARRGLGIGLSVVQGAVDAMGGRVAAEAGPGGRGLAIVLDLPVAPPPTGEPALPALPASRQADGPAT